MPRENFTGRPVLPGPLSIKANPPAFTEAGLPRAGEIFVGRVDAMDATCVWVAVPPAYDVFQARGELDPAAAGPNCKEGLTALFTVTGAPIADDDIVVLPLRLATLAGA